MSQDINDTFCIARAEVPVQFKGYMIYWRVRRYTGKLRFSGAHVSDDFTVGDRSV